MTSLSQRHPWLRPVAVGVHRTRRRLTWCRPGTDWAVDRRSTLPVRLMRHDSPLLRDLAGAAMELQHGKVVNLRLATARVDGLVLRPGQTLSFNRVVGSCSRRRGYVDGLRLSGGRPVPGAGSGVCQLANLLHWLVPHSPLTVLVRSEHSVDPFPDSGRVVPWGVGCTIAYNYIDLVVRNDTATTFQLRTRVVRRTCAVSCVPTGRRPTPTSCRPGPRSSSASTASCTGATRSGGPSRRGPARRTTSWSGATAPGWPTRSTPRWSGRRARRAVSCPPLTGRHR
jgi:vancomycin resistance protein VanW